MSICAGCGAEISWERTASGRSTPVDADGTPHWATCSQAAAFRRRRGQEQLHCSACGRLTLHQVERSGRREIARCLACFRGFEVREVPRSAHG